MSHQRNLVEINKSRLRALTPAPEGVSQEPNLAEIKKSLLFVIDIKNVQKSQRLGAHSGAERREPGAKSNRDQQIKITPLKL